MSRQGKHRDDKHRVQAYYEAEQKALFVLVSRIDGKSITDSVFDAIQNRAQQLGIVDANGRVTPNFKDALEVETSIIKQAERRRIK